MEKWEYLTATVGHQNQLDAKMKSINGHDLPEWKSILLVNALAILGEDGWELVGVNPGGLDPIVFFKRPWGGAAYNVESFSSRVRQ